MGEIIKATHINKTFINGKLEVEVLKDISLTVEQGEFISIMGPSGSGKSTLLYLLGGLDEISGGEIIFNGKPINKMSDKEQSIMRRRKMGFVFQFYNLVPNLSVKDNVLLPVVLDGCNPKKYKDALDEILGIVGLQEKKDYKPNQLSGGQQQRVAIARALINNPDIILADEPIGNLDSKSGTEVMELLKRINLENGKTIIQVTHSPEASTYGNRVIYVRDGMVSEK